MKRLIVTICTPEYEEFNDLTYVSRVRYAEQCGAMHSAIRHVSALDQSPTPHFAKYKLLCEARDAGIEEVLYLDNDIYVRDGAPNIFTEIQQTAMYNEVPHPHPPVLQRAYKWIEAELGEFDRSRYYNTGVMLFRLHELEDLVPLLRRVEQKQGPFYEQDQLNYLIQQSGIPVAELHQRWNQCCGARHLTDAKAKRAYFLHGNGTKKFSTKLARFRKIIEEYP